MLKHNILANFAGKAWTALMALIFVPLYIKFMGVESYGLIGVFTSLQAIFSLLDMGLSTTLNRELARRSVLPDTAQETRNLIRTLELIYWGIAIGIAIIVMSLSSLLAHYWVTPKQLSRTTVQEAFMLMGGIMALQWPLQLYAGGLRGLQRQVLLNSIDLGAATLRGIGAILILWLVSPTIQAFFIWQSIVSLFHTSVTAAVLWKNVPKTPDGARFQIHSLLQIWRFAVGITGISVTVLFLTQTDKILLSKLLTLEMFGYYTFANVIASTLYRIIEPIFTAVFPSFSQLVSLQDEMRLKELYHKSCQFMSVMILPPAIVVAFFASEILLLWTRNPLTVEYTHRIVTFYIVGTALNGLIHIPYALQLSYGWTKLALYTNIIATIVLVPLLFFLVNQYGPVGAAMTWIVLNSGYVVINMQIMHSRLLKGEQWRWYVQDVGIPVTTALTIAFLCKVFIPIPLQRFDTLIYLIMVSFMTFVGSVLCTHYPRVWIVQRLQLRTH
jgi:O-antigen/teichoic acid export membrane protein